MPTKNEDNLTFKSRLQIREAKQKQNFVTSSLTFIDFTFIIHY